MRFNKRAAFDLLLKTRLWTKTGPKPDPAYEKFVGKKLKISFNI